MKDRASRITASTASLLVSALLAASLLIHYQYIPSVPSLEFISLWGSTLVSRLSHAAWYIPLFFLVLSAAAAGRREKLFSLLLFSLLPFAAAVLLLQLLGMGPASRVSIAAADLAGLQASRYIVSIVLALLLGIMAASGLGRKKRSSSPNQPQPQEAPEPDDQVREDGPELRFPSVPDVPDLTSFRRKYTPPFEEHDMDEADELPVSEADLYDQVEPEPEPVPKQARPIFDEPQIVRPKKRVEPAEETLPEGFGLPSVSEEPDALPPEDPQFQNIEPEIPLAKDEQDEIDRDWIRREAELPNTAKPQKSGSSAKPYEAPPESLLAEYPRVTDEDDAYTQRASEALMQTFREFGIEAKLTGIQKGPVVTMFEILPAPGVRVSAITNLSDNIALQLAASRVRIVAPIPGKQAVGIEVPNRKRTIVSFREMLAAIDHHGHYKIPMVLGKDIMGHLNVIDLVRTPHLLIAGATGSGKSVCVNALICSILYRRSPKDVRLMLIDPKIVELKLYNDIPHLLTPVITDAKKTLKALQYCIYEMERRYKLLDALGVRDISSYNTKIKTKELTAEHLPYIVVMIDEFADLMNTIGKELEHYLARLAAMARAVGIHLVLATQRPSTNVITGLIKANIPSRIAFMVVSNTDSRIIIDMPGAEKLLGKGDMLFLSSWEAYPTRIQGAFLSEEEVERIAEYVKSSGEPDYLDDSYFLDDEDDDMDDDVNGDSYEDDPLMPQAVRIVQERSVASASMLQRRLKIGYNRAARMIETMEQMGLVGPAQGSKPRDVLRYSDLGDM